MSAKRRILLIDPEEVSREALAVRLRTLGYDVATANDGVQGAHEALERPPSAVIADLAMPSISGAQLCRLLKAEPATQDVPVILRGEEGHRNRFWAEQTGALAYVIKGRMGDLVRAMNRGFEGAPEEDEFFMALSCDVSVRDRIAQCLDAALFDSVIAAEVRKLAVCECFDTLFDLFAQFVSQVTTYRWLSVVTDAPVRGGVHAQPGQSARALEEAIAALGVAPETRFTLIEDEDPSCDGEGPPPLVRPITFGDTRLGAIALAPRAASAREDAALLEICARWGGEEFVILLTSTDLPGGAQAAERVRAAIEAMRVDNDRGERIPVTASFGVATLEPNEEMDALVDRADRAMYLAKTSGRNRVELELAHEDAAE